MCVTVTVTVASGGLRRLACELQHYRRTDLDDYNHSAEVSCLTLSFNNYALRHLRCTWCHDMSPQTALSKRTLLNYRLDDCDLGSTQVFAVKGRADDDEK